MDNEFRIFILEGIGSKAMRMLERTTRLVDPNT